MNRLRSGTRALVCPSQTRPLFEGEVHAGCMNFLGPGTNINARIARGDQPVGPGDAYGMQHDIDYRNIAIARKQGKITDKEVKQMVRDSDNRLIEGLNTVKNKGSIWNKMASHASQQIIQGKKGLENMGVLKSSAFVGEGLKKPCGKCRRCKDDKKCKKLCPNYALRRRAKQIAGQLKSKAKSKPTYTTRPVIDEREILYKYV